MTEQPSLARQIEAVQWAALHIAPEHGKFEPRAMRESEKQRFRAALEAAVETLQMLEFGRETAP